MIEAAPKAMAPGEPRVTPVSRGSARLAPDAQLQPARLRIGIEATCWHNGRGYGRHARALLEALICQDAGNDYVLFMDAPPQSLPPGLRADVRVIRSKAPASLAASADGHRSPADMWRMGRALSDRSIDVLIFPSVYSFVPVFSRAGRSSLSTT